MAVNTITYANKVTLNENPNIDAVNKCQASDMNEIKNVVNNNANELSQMITNTTIATLYEDATGTTGNIVLNDTISNYKYIEFFVRNSGNDFLHAGQKFYTNNSSQAKIYLDLVSNGNGVIDLRALRCIIDGANVTMSYFYKALVLSGQTPSGGTNNNTEQLIYKIIGYK